MELKHESNEYQVTLEHIRMIMEFPPYESGALKVTMIGKIVSVLIICLVCAQLIGLAIVQDHKDHRMYHRR